VFLTKRQSELLDYLRRTIAVQGYAPSLEEMAAHFQLSSVGTVHKHLKALEEKGFIRRQWNRSRAIEIVETPDGRARRVPMLGSLRGKQPIENGVQTGSIAVPEEFLNGHGAFVLQVGDDSLRDEFLDCGDFVVCEPSERPQPGDTVVVTVDGHSTMVRRWEPMSDRVQLRSRRPGAEAVEVGVQRCRVEGVVVGVLRRLQADRPTAG
jgi:repressor LexA